jgi:hypothetical protein
MNIFSISNKRSNRRSNIRGWHLKYTNKWVIVKRRDNIFGVGHRWGTTTTLINQNKRSRLKRGDSATTAIVAASTLQTENKTNIHQVRR